ncbi:Coronin-7 [Nymphon striatum]|nr:Coronin-7 [Nymphon striatum]
MLDQIFRLGTSNIKLHTNTNKIRLEKGVRQGDSISPKLFTACLENVFRGLNWTSKGIPINGDRLTNLRFADDVVLFSESPQELQLMVEELRTASSKVGLEINLSKTKVMFNRNIEIQPIMTGNVALDQVDRYIYLGQLISIHRDWEPEVRRRVALGWQAFGRLNNVWSSKLPLCLKRKGWILDISCGSPQSCGQHIKASGTFMVFNTDTRGGGSLAILPLNDHGRKHKGKLPMIHGHTDLVTDFDFSPFDDGLLATCSSDTTVITFINDDLEDQCYGISWKGDGSLLASVCKDQQMRIFDPRTNTVAQQCINYPSPKDTKVVWIGDGDRIVTTGFDSCRQREVILRDVRNIKSPVASVQLDMATGILMPLYDPDTNLLFLAGKGESTIMMWEITNQEPFLPEASKHVSEVQSKGACLVPKRILDVMQGEVARILQISSKCIVPITYQVPRRRVNDGLPTEDYSNILSLVDLILSLPVKSAECERVFSNMKLVKSDWRSVLKSKNLSDQLMVILATNDIDQYDPLPAIRLWNSAGSKPKRPCTAPYGSYREFHSELFPDTCGPVPGMTCRDWLSGQNNTPPKISLNPANRPETYVRFSVNPKEKDSSIPHGQAKHSSESKSIQNGSTNVNEGKTAKDNLNFHTQNRVEMPQLKHVTPSKPAVLQKPGLSTQNDEPSIPRKHSNSSSETAKSITEIQEEIDIDKVKSTQKEFQERINSSAREASPVLRKKELAVNKEVQRVSSFKTPSRPTSKVFQMRTSKFRHLKGIALHQKNHIENIRNINRTIPNESNAFSCNKKFAAVPLAGPGGQIAILDLAKTGKLGDTVLSRVICGTKVMDFEWDPFNDNKLVTVCDDGKMLIWDIPEGGLVESTNSPSESIDAHHERIYLVKFHPFANNIIATASYDMTIKIWDLSNLHDASIVLDDLNEQIFCMAWSPNGEYIVTVSKDKKVKIFQPRASTTPIKETAGPYWCTWGSSSERILYLYEFADMKKPLTTFEIDISPAILVPHYDEDSSTLFLSAKGESTILAFEVAYDAPYFHQLSHVKCSSPHQALTFLSKNVCNVREVEFARSLRLLPSSIEPMSFSVPRVKKEFFQNDLFPETRVTWEPSMSGTDWLAGKNGKACKISLKPPEMKNWITEKIEDRPSKVNQVSKSASNRTPSPVQNLTDMGEKEKSEKLVSAMKEKFSLETGDLPQQNFDGVDANEWVIIVLLFTPSYQLICTSEHSGSSTSIIVKIFFVMLYLLIDHLISEFSHL